MDQNISLPSYTPFAFRGELLRVATCDGEPWFVLNEVCKVLGIANTGNAAARLDDDEKGIRLADTPGGPQKIIMISKSGLYRLVMRSDKPEAKRFQKWVTGEVLPAIRKTGGYGQPAPNFDTLLNDPVVLRILLSGYAERG